MMIRVDPRSHSTISASYCIVGFTAVDDPFPPFNSMPGYRCAGISYPLNRCRLSPLSFRFEIRGVDQGGSMPGPTGFPHTEVPAVSAGGISILKGG